MIKYKKCRECNIEKNISFFSSNELKRNKSRCKYCAQEYQKKYNKKNEDKIKKRRKKNYQENKDKILKGRKEYYKNNINDILNDRKIYYKNNENNIQKYQKKYRLENKDKIKKDKKEYYENNRDDILSEKKVYYQEHKGESEKYHKEYYKKNKEKIKNDVKIYNFRDDVKKRKQKNRKIKRQQNPTHKLREDISNSIRHVLKKKKGGKSILKYLPYTMEELKKHIEDQFEPWMTWDNWGRYSPKTHKENPTWQLDHINPHSDFHYENMECDEFQECWALSNLRPLDSEKNITDGVNRVRHAR